MDTNLTVKFDFDHIHLKCHNVQFAKDFYERMFRAEIQFEGKVRNAPFIMIKLGGVFVGLSGTIEGEQLESLSKPRGDAWIRYGIGHLCFRVLEFEKTLQKLNEKRAEYIWEPRILAGIKVAFIRGPEDDAIEIIQRPSGTIGPEGSKNMMEKGSEAEFIFDHLHLKCHDIGSTRKFYEKMFNAETVSEGKARNASTCKIKIGKHIVNISEKAEGDVLDELQTEPRENIWIRYGIGHFGVRAGDLDEAVHELKKKGAEFVWEPRHIREGVRVAFIRAPEDDVIEIVQRG